MAIIKTLLDGLLYTLIFLVFVLILGFIGQKIIQKPYFDFFWKHTYLFIFVQWVCIIVFNSFVFTLFKRNYTKSSVFWETFIIGSLCAIAAIVVFSALFQFSSMTFNIVFDVILLLLVWHNMAEAMLVLVGFFIGYTLLFATLKMIMDRIVWNKLAKVA